MRFNKNVPLKDREVLAAQLKQYEKETAMTSDERRELYIWVASGHSPYDNGDHICNEKGWPMDFVHALRFEKEQMEWYQSLTEDEKDALVQDTGMFKEEQTEELPFR